jgi:hypothetical protein
MMRLQRASVFALSLLASAATATPSARGCCGNRQLRGRHHQRLLRKLSGLPLQQRQRSQSVSRRRPYNGNGEKAIGRRSAKRHHHAD